jgi:superfamily I DNA/RNA helicase
MISLAGLNSPQQKAAAHVDGPLLVLAGAGSGKTRTVTYRIANLIENHGVKGKEILGVTFTNKAAQEMRERVRTLLSKPKSRGLTLSTFHSLGVRILRKEIESIGYHKDFSIYDSSDQVSIVREALKNFHAEKSFDQKDVLSRIGFLKNHGVSCDEYANSKYFVDDDAYCHATEYVYRFYQDKLKFYNAIDFDDILFLTVKVFKDFPEIAKKYSEQYRYILIDEYQDTNPLQFALIAGLTSTHQNLCVVGDDDQSIYGFRGADIRNILEFEKHYKDAVVVKLEENYRSSNPILTLANEVIAKNKNRMDKKLWSKSTGTDLPLLWACGQTEHEAQVISDEISHYQSEGKPLNEVAILYRSNTQAAVIESELRLANIPYQMLGGQKLYDKKEIKDLIAYLSVIHNPQDEISLRRILNVPNRGIGNATLDKFLLRSKTQGTTLFEALRDAKNTEPNKAELILQFMKLLDDLKKIFSTASLPEGVSLLIEKTDYYNFLVKMYDNPKQIERRREDITRFIEGAKRFQDYHGQYATLENFIERMLLQDNQTDENGEEGDLRRNEVTMMTLHSAKGLEFDVIFLVGLEEEILPHKKTIVSGENIEEERRLCYVGITRAREKLIMTYCKERKLYGKDVVRFRSRFLNDLMTQNLFIEQDRTTFGHLSKDEAKQYQKSFFNNLIDEIED